MGLITCEDCGAQVSDKATACPKCARPLGAATLIEQTAKRWKLVQLIGAGIILFGIVLVVVALVLVVNGLGWHRTPSFVNPFLWIGYVSMGVGLVVVTVGLVAAWWHHG